MVRQLRQELLLRWRRALPLSLGASVRAVVLVGYCLVLALGVLVVTGWRGPSGASGDNTDWPLLRGTTVIATAVISLALTLAAVRSSTWKRIGLSAITVVLTLNTVAGWPHAVSRPGLLLFCLGCTVIALVPRPGASVLETLRCVLAVVPFVAVLPGHILGGPGSQAIQSAIDLQLVPTAIIGLSFAAAFALANSAQSVRERATKLSAWRITRGAVVAAALAKLVVLVAAYLHLVGDFLGGPVYWRARLDQPLTWLHAVCVAALVVTVAVRSVANPLPARGFTPRLAVLAALFGFASIGAVAAIVVVRTLATLGYPAASLLTWWNAVISFAPIVQVAGAVAIMISSIGGLVRSRRLTLGIYLWLAASLWLIPPLLGSLGVGLFGGSGVAFAATPAQVEVVLTCAVVVVVWVPRVGGSGRHLRALFGLVLVPTLVLDLPHLWPGQWMDFVLQIGLVGSALVTLFWSPPMVSSNQHRVEGSRALAVAGQLGILLAYVYALRDRPQMAGLDAAAILAWLWLGVPIVAALTARVAPTQAAPDLTDADLSTAGPVG